VASEHIIHFVNPQALTNSGCVLSPQKLE